MWFFRISTGKNKAKRIDPSRKTIRKQHTISKSDAFDLVMRSRPHLTCSEARMLTETFLRLTGGGNFHLTVARHHITKLMESSTNVVGDQECVNNLLNLFVERQRQGISLKQFIEVSRVWHETTHDELLELQFAVFDQDKDGILSERDLARCLMYGMPDKLQQVMRTMETGITLPGFKTCLRAGGVTLTRLHLGVLTYRIDRADSHSFASVDLVAPEAQFRVAVSEITQALGGNLRIYESTPVECVAVAVGFSDETIDLPMASYIQEI